MSNIANDPSEFKEVTRKETNAKHWFGIRKFKVFKFLIFRYLEQLPKRLATVLHSNARKS